MADSNRLEHFAVHPDHDLAISVGRRVGASGLVVDLQGPVGLRLRPRLLGGSARQELGCWADHGCAGRIRRSQRIEMWWPLPLLARASQLIAAHTLVAYVV